MIWIKTGFQVMLTLPCTLIASVCLAIALALPMWQGVVLFVAMALFAVAHACFSMLMGLTFPKLDAANETVVVKQSLAVLLSMFVPMGVLVVIGLVCWVPFGEIGAAVASLVLLMALTAICVGILSRKGPEMVRGL